MCLPNFIEFKKILKKDAVIGYRSWLLNIKNENDLLKSINQNFEWNKQIIKADKVIEENSGLYSYNYYNNNYNNNNHNYNNNYNNNNHNYNYYISGIIHQYGKTAIHSTGYRSQYAIIDTLFTIRKSDAQGPEKFLDWIDIFNNRIEKLAKFYECKTITWQNFNENMINKRINDKKESSTT